AAARFAANVHRAGLMNHRNRSRPFAAVIGIALALCVSGIVHAGPAERAQARRIHDRIAGVPPDAATLDVMEQDILAGQPTQAARRAMEAKTFYTTVLKNWVTPWTNREQTVFAPLNDYTATVIGMV